MSIPALTIQFLGTGTSTGIPMIGCDCAVCQSLDPADKRLRTSILVSSAKTTLVVDTTPDFRYQMLRSRTRQLDAVLYTHSHKDHTAGLDDVRAFNFFSGKSMPLYADADTAAAIRRDYYYAFEKSTYPGVPRLDLLSLDGSPFWVGDIPVQPIAVLHHRLPVWGFRFGDFTYITDANYIAPTELDKIRGSQVMVLNALRKESHLSHFTLSEAVALGQSVQVPQVYFTHISHQMGLQASINSELPAGFSLAHDQLVLHLPGKD